MSLDTIAHQAAALARLAQFLKGKVNAAAVFGALNSRTQEVEAAFQQLLIDRSLAVAVGAQLDVLGRIVGQVRGGMIDADYRITIRARVKINNSSGTVPEILEIFEILIPVNATLNLRDEPPAAFTIEFNTVGLTVAQASVFVQLLRIMKAAGVRALMEFGLRSAASTFRFDGAAGVGGFDSVYFFRATLI